MSTPPLTLAGSPARRDTLSPGGGLVGAFVAFCVDQKLVLFLLTVALVGWGVFTAPFAWKLPVERSPVAVDAIPDLGENQQIVVADWPGRSPQDVEDQVTYPLTVQLLGLPGVRTIRSQSMFGFTSVFVIFEEGVDFYWSRSRVLEKLASLPPDLLPEGVRPSLGPDATAMGQVFWYTLEGRDAAGRPAGGWDLDELRATQDWYVRFALQAVPGVAEVASIGGFVREYQVDVDPDALRAFDLTLEMVADAARRANLDVGARTIEINGVEYLVRGRGFVRSIEDLEQAVVAARGGVPITLRQVARVELGPALRTGGLDKGGAEAVGGVVVARHGANPLEVIERVRERMAAIAPGLPRRTLADGTLSQVTIVPFYDRTELIHETLGTLGDALRDQVIVTVIVVIAMAAHLRAAFLISAMLPLTVLACFGMMKQAGVDANIVSLSGIAIAIGTVVDMGIILTENILRRLDEAPEGSDPRDVIVAAGTEVGGAILTAVATTIIGFLPVFVMTGAEGKLFQPLAWTKTFALAASLVLAVALIPPLAHVFFRRRAARMRRLPATLWGAAIAAAGAAVIGAGGPAWGGALVVAFGAGRVLLAWTDAPGARRVVERAALVAVLLAFAHLLATTWEPLGVQHPSWRNDLFVLGVLGGLLGVLGVFALLYERLLRLALRFKVLFLALPGTVLLAGLAAWLGAERLMAPLPALLRESAAARRLAALFPGMGREFMPTLAEGSFLYMPVTMPHGSIGEAMDLLAQLDRAIEAIPEVASVVGKIGRAESALDPAPIEMIESVITLRPEYLIDPAGRRLTFRHDGTRFVRDAAGELVPDPDGRPFRLWRDEVRSEGDVWDAIVAAARLPGLTTAPRLQPIAARVVMLQSGMRAPMGIKIKGPDLATIERVGLRVEQLLREVEGVRGEAVVADRIVGKPYLEVVIDRERIARYGISIATVQEVLEAALGGMTVTRTVEGRERFDVRVRYLRELRDSPEAIGRILVPAPAEATAPRPAAGGPDAAAAAMAPAMPAHVPLDQLADIRIVRGPQMIRSEDTFLLGYVLFDKREGFAEVDVIEAARDHLRRHLDPDLPAGVAYEFAGTWENQVRARRTLAIVLPLSLLMILVILQLEFRSLPTSLLVFSGILVAGAGGFIMLWLYAQPWFLDVEVMGRSLREVFLVQPFHLSVAVWVGFLALFGIAEDDGVVISTYIRQQLAATPPRDVAELREAIVAAGRRRLLPCLMTTATTILALLPVLTSDGRGAEIMVPMAIPSFGGMCFELLTLFVVPVLTCALEEARLLRAAPAAPPSEEAAT